MYNIDNRNIDTADIDEVCLLCRRGNPVKYKGELSQYISMSDPINQMFFNTFFTIMDYLWVMNQNLRLDGFVVKTKDGKHRFVFNMDDINHEGIIVNKNSLALMISVCDYVCTQEIPKMKLYNKETGLYEDYTPSVLKKRGGK